MMPIFLPMPCHWKQAAPKVFLWSAVDSEPQTPVLEAVSHSGNSLTGGEVLPVWSHRGPTPLSVYILRVHFASRALRSTSTAAKCCRGASRRWAIMENIFHPDPLELLELPHHFVQRMFKALQSCDVKLLQITAFCCNLTLMNACGERKRGKQDWASPDTKNPNPTSRELSALSVYFASELLDTNATMAHMLNFGEQSC